MDESLNTYYQLINQQQQANNAWSAEQAQKAMDYQTEMSNTAHQREVADLKAAGLNPVLSAGGQGATTGSGHAASAGDGNVTALYGMISKVLDAQLEQAKAMQTTAKAVGGSGGSSKPVSTNGFDTGSDTGNSVKDIISDILKRKVGIDPKHVDALLNSVIGQEGDSYKKAMEYVNSLPNSLKSKVSVNRNGEIIYHLPDGSVTRDRSKMKPGERFSLWLFDKMNEQKNNWKPEKKESGYGSSYYTGNGSSGRGGSFSGSKGKF